jgi:hypothetical protein
VLWNLISAKAASASRRAVCAGAALLLPALASLPATPAYADRLIVSGCAGRIWGSFNCVTRKGPAGDPYVRLVPAPQGEAEQARIIDRDHRWQDRCRPVIAQDRYGVPRYRYAAPGCEFGVVE